MKRVIVKLTDGTTYEYAKAHVWIYEDELNDTRKEFVRLGDLVVRKSNISTIETIELEEDYVEVETNE